VRANSLDLGWHQLFARRKAPDIFDIPAMGVSEFFTVGGNQGFAPRRLCIKSTGYDDWLRLCLIDERRVDDKDQLFSTHLPA
jgi:hypothetical protein